jgi:hypothetical protein
MAFITDPKVIDGILAHLKRTAHPGSRSRAPPGRWRTTPASAPASAHADLPARSPLGAPWVAPLRRSALPRPTLTPTMVRIVLPTEVGAYHGAVGDLIPAAGQRRGRAAYFAGAKANSYAVCRPRSTARRICGSWGSMARAPGCSSGRPRCQPGTHEPSSGAGPDVIPSEGRRADICHSERSARRARSRGIAVVPKEGSAPLPG